MYKILHNEAVVANVNNCAIASITFTIFSLAKRRIGVFYFKKGGSCECLHQRMLLLLVLFCYRYQKVPGKHFDSYVQDVSKRVFELFEAIAVEAFCLKRLPSSL